MTERTGKGSHILTLLIQVGYLIRELKKCLCRYYIVNSTSLSELMVVFYFVVKCKGR